MHGTHKPSYGPKSVLTAIHLAALAGLACWLYGRGSAGALPADELRLALTLGCGLVYFLRMLGTQYFFVRRALPWSEAAIVGLWIATIHAVFAYCAAANPAPVGPFAWFGLALYCLGSYLNTASEWQRRRFKDDPAHHGRLFTGGLFRYSMHVNYFGDSLLFSGFALIVGDWWAALVPLIMTLGFLFQHIPQLDAYLAERYGDDFAEYRARTAKFVPFLY